jgi:N-acetylglucosamine kinase-like BadF-type ATPase
MMTSESIKAVLTDEYTGPKEGIEAVYFYGAGCGPAFPAATATLAEVVNEFFGCSKLEATSDLVASARAVCGHEAGIACILGTGANSCYYDGTEIVKNVRPLGFILGDEGSGAVMGKKLLADVLKGLFPEDLTKLFYEDYPYEYIDFINNVYNKPRPQPNRFMASMTRFLSKHIDRPECVKIVEQSFTEFVERNILQYEQAKDCPISFVGSIAYYFRPQLEKVLNNYGLKIGNISQVPMDGLVEYHKNAK